jgi:hypothetical protein
MGGRSGRRSRCTQPEADKCGLSRVECGQVFAKDEEAEKRGLGTRGLRDVTGRRNCSIFDG